MTLNKKTLLTYILLIISITSFSQTNEDVSKYFDDDGISNSKNLIKLNLASIITGDLHFSYERLLTRSFSIEIGTGLLLPYYTKELTNRIHSFEETEETKTIISNPDSGISFSVQPKLYFGSEAPELSYIGILYRTRIYNQNNEKITVNDYVFNSGYQISLATRILLDFSIGVGFRLNKNSTTSDKSTNLAIPIGLKIGYLF